MSTIKNYKNLVYLFIGTILALLPSFLIRVNYDFSMVLFEKFGTYLGDIWNFFANYLQEGLAFPPEYPVGIRFIYELFQFNKIHTLSNFFSINACILTICALTITYILYLIVKENYKKISSIWYYWILAPSFIVYSLYNYDLLAITFTILAYYLLTKNKYNYSAISLAIGAIIKFFPVYLLPIFIINLPKEKRLKYFVIFVITFLVCNLPYMISNFSTWAHPYLWQITNNLSHSAREQTYWWMLYPYLGKSLGIISIILFAGLYIYFVIKLKNKPLPVQIVAILILFLLTDRIYSPQYNLYLLPFLVILPYFINKPIFYLLELINVAVIIFFFKLTNNVILLQSMVFIRYFLLIILFIINYQYAFKKDIKKI
jgi:uncharacterized membrane protein